MVMTVVDVIVSITVFLFGLYYYGTKTYDHFKETGIKYLKPTLPFLGSMSDVIRGRLDYYAVIKRDYMKFPDEKYIGGFEGRKPTIMLKDLDLIKSIAIKNFDSFHDRRTLSQSNPDDIIIHILSLMRGDKWREMRAALSPAFTSSKMRNMFVFMEECAKDVTQFFLNRKEIKENRIIEIDVKDTTARYTNDVIANTVFGFKINSLEDRDNDVYKFGALVNDQSFLHLLKLYGFLFVPWLMQLLKFTILRPFVSKFFENLVKDTMESREKTGFIRHDMINLLMEARKGMLVHDKDSGETIEVGFATAQESYIGKQEVKKKWTDLELAAQALIFFIAGFDTTSTILTFFCYEMIRNPEVQSRLQEEIDDYLSKSDGKFGYYDVLNMKYLDMCISETLRMWPPLGSIDRTCTTPFTLPPPNNKTNKTYQVVKDQLVLIPIYAIMQDPNHYPEPEKFDPERFSDENKSSINPTSYLPFGIGPRNCIGSRFGLLKMKIFICHLLSKFTIVPCAKTRLPIKLQKGIVQAKPLDFYVGLKLR